MEEKKDIKKIYSEMQKKLGLPDFAAMDNEFEISTIEAEDFLLREIRRRVHDKIDAICKSLDSVLQPEATLHQMYESGVFSDEEKKQIYLMYKSLMNMHREGMMLEIQCLNDLDAKFIKDFMAKWKKIKPQLVDIFKKLAESWTKDSDIEEKLGYFG